MPITQDRLLSLIEAAEKYIEREEKLRDFLSHFYLEVATGKLDPLTGWTMINIELLTTRDDDPTEKITVNRERLKHLLTHSRNSIEKARQRLHREHKRRTGEGDYWPPRSMLPQAAELPPLEADTIIMGRYESSEIDLPAMHPEVRARYEQAMRLVREARAAKVAKQAAEITPKIVPDNDSDLDLGGQS